MQESLLTTLDQFTPEILVILAGLLVITTTLFLWLWFANRRSYNMLKHQLPANVVKTYLDSIIQNSTSLKSQLFRGGGADVAAGAAVPTIFPVGNLGGGESVVVAGGNGNEAALREQLNQRLAEIASLQSQLAASNSAKSELETALAAARARIKELEDLLAKAGIAGGDAAIAAELQKITKERDALREKLKEYEIIEDDLANLKRLQQENAQLRKALEGRGGVPPLEAMPAAPEATPLAPSPESLPSMAGQDPLDTANDIFAEVAPSPAAAPTEEDATAELAKFLGNSTPETPVAEAAAPAAAVQIAAPEDVPAPPEKKAANDKTPEDLLSEFEKMLG